MKCPLRIDSEGNALSCYKEECAWWVMDVEIEGSKTYGACAILEVAVNGIIVTIGDDDDEEGSVTR
jgi:diphthamide synthase subunit DPH2